jgi:hypothetical protein
MIRASGLSLGRVMWPVPRRADPPINFLRVFGRHRLRGSISPDAANALATAIQTHEGYAPGTLAYQNNNPGNLVYAGQPGATRGAGGFAAFNSYTAGYTAEVNQITLDAVRGSDVNGNPINDVADLIGSWAPASDPRNDTAAYIAAVSAQTGYDPYAPLSSLGAPGISAPLPDLAPVDSASADLADIASGSVDLSSIGLPSDVPGYALLGVAAVAAVLLLR